MTLELGGSHGPTPQSPQTSTAVAVRLLSDCAVGPGKAGSAARKRLIDQAAFREVIERASAELILHGHHHRFSQDELATPDGRAPVIGVPSGSASRCLGHLHASYHLCRIDAKTAGWQLQIEVRGLAETEDRFDTERVFEIMIRNDSACTTVSMASAPR